jgi:cytochrome P450
VQKRNATESKEDNITFFFSPEIYADEFVVQSFGFLITGFETAATALSFAPQKLALHLEIQKRLRAEIMQLLNKHNGQLTYHGIEEMVYRRWPTWTWLC